MNNILAKPNITLYQHVKDCLISFDKLCESLPNDIRKNLEEIKDDIRLAILLHDLGKVLPYFQIVLLKNMNYKPFDINKLLNIYHSLASILFIDKVKLKEKFTNVEYILSAIAYHHWKKSLEEDLRFKAEKFKYFLAKYNDYKEQLIENLKNEMRSIVNSNLKIEDFISLDIDMLNGLANGISLANYVRPPYQLYWLPKRLEIKEKEKKNWIFISGFLQRCDHYASFCEETKSEDFSKIEIPNLKFGEIENNIVNQIKNNNPWQKEIVKDCKNDNAILLAPTGSGKTEFAFLWSNGEKFFYTLPIRTAVEQIFNRAKTIFGEDKTGILHSDADVYLLGNDYNYENVKVYEVAKQLAYPVIISTGDQFFPYGLRPPGYERIYATFSYSRLVVDEVQSYDPRAAAIIVKFIEDIVRLGGKFLLMTATLPKYIKEEIEKRINIEKNKNFVEKNLYEEEKQKYTNIVKHKLKFKEIKNTKDFSIPDDIIDQIIQDAKNKRVLVILNTIKQAKNVYKKILNKNKYIDENKIIIFHSQFTLNEKNKKIKDIEKEFENPKKESDNEGKILIATQVVEASINIDADILYTEICPMDALVQRMGRILRRHKEKFKLSKDDEPNVFVLFFEKGYESGNGYVYDNELITKTKSLLFDKSKDILELSEYEKFDLVNKLYSSLDSNSKYYLKFYETLSVLDAGFMSDRKGEAQRIFREILNVPVIYANEKNRFKEKIKRLISEDNLEYLNFKKEIVADFVISVPYFKLNEFKIGKAIDWLNEITYKNNNENLDKIKKWCEEIFIFSNMD